MIRADGSRNPMGWAALVVGTLISGAVLHHWLFAVNDVRTHDVVLSGAFFGGLAIAFPAQVSQYAQSVSGLIRSWRAK